MADILSPAIGDVITPDGVATVELFVWMDSITQAVNSIQPLTGSGSPEGVTIAGPGRWYVDTDAAAGTGIYFKESGSGDTGWIIRS